MKIVVIGGSGLIGSAVVTRLRARGYETLPASPTTGVNTLTGDGLADALSGASVVIDVSDSPSFEDDATLRFFDKSTRNLLAAETSSGVRHHVALSVVGADRLPESGYFRAKLAQEELITSSSIPYSIVRATQFFEFVMRIADAASDGGTVRLPPVLFQPVAADDVAATVSRIAVGAPANGIVEIAGPERFRFDEFVWDDLTVRDDPRSVVTDPVARHFGALLSERSLVPGDGATLAETRFADWLSRRTTGKRAGQYVSAGARDLEREISAELALAESSRLDEALRDPVADWRFDPTEAQRYEVVLHGLLGAMVLPDDRPQRDRPASG